MSENFEIDLEQQLQTELNRFKKAIEYIEQAKLIFDHSQLLFENMESKFKEMANLQDTLKDSFQSCVSGTDDKTKTIQISLENKFKNQFSSIQQDIQKLSTTTLLIKEFENQRNEFVEQQKLIETSFKRQYFEQNMKVENLTKKAKNSKTFNYVLLVLLIATLIIAIIK